MTTSKDYLEGRKFRSTEFTHFCFVCSLDTDYRIVEVIDIQPYRYGTELITANIQSICSCCEYYPDIKFRLDKLVWLDSIKKTFFPFKKWKPKHVKIS